MPETKMSEPQCGRTEAISGRIYPPCVREADHREAFCKNADGDLFLCSGTGVRL